MRRWSELPKPSAGWNRLVALAFLGLAGCAPSIAPPPAGLPPREPMVRVGLAVDTARVTLQGTSNLELVDDAGRTFATVPAATDLTVGATSSGGLTLSGVPAAAPASGSIRVRPAGGEGFVSIDGRPYRGEVLVRPSAGSGLTVVNEVAMEEYLLGVVPNEIGRVGPELLEAAKAQAVAARTYAVRYLGRRESLGFDVFATVEDQVYGGASGEHEPVTRAVLETAGEILTFDGQPIEAFYHSTCAGRTAAIEEVWPEEEPRPYLVSVEDVDPRTGEAYDASSSRFRWTQRWTGRQLSDILQETLRDSLPIGTSYIGDLQDFTVLERTPSGRISEMLISTSIASFIVGGDRIRWIFLTPEGSILNSSMFDLSVERDPRGRVTAVVAEGGGWGHGIGMCQVGAMGRARAGQDYRTILRAYYPRTEITDLY